MNDNNGERAKRLLSDINRQMREEQEQVDRLLDIMRKQEQHQKRTALFAAWMKVFVVLAVALAAISILLPWLASLLTP